MSKTNLNAAFVEKKPIVIKKKIKSLSVHIYLLLAYMMHVFSS